MVKNGPHWWMADMATIRFGIEETEVGGIGFRKVARLPAFIAKSGSVEPPRYQVLEANKQGVNLYSGRRARVRAGLARRQGVRAAVDEHPARRARDSLGDRLTPAEGWQFRTRTLDEDWAISMSGKVKVAADDFKNIYNLPPEADEPPQESQGEAKELDVVIAVFPGPVSAGEAFDAFLALAEEGTIRTDGAVLVTRDDAGEVQVEESGDHAGRKGAKVGGGVGLVVGLFSPPLLAATAVGAAGGALAARFAKKRVTHGIGEKMDEALPPGAAGIIAVYDHANAADVDRALGDAFTKSVAGIDKASVKELKAGLTEAQGGLG